MNRRHFVLVAALVPLVAAYSCRRREDAALPELPKEIASNLKALPGTELMVSTPSLKPANPPQPAPIPPPPPAEKACKTTQDFFSYVLFPVTICTSNPPFGDVLDQYQAATIPRTSALGAGEIKSFKLTSLEGRNVSPFLVCQRRSGPWGAFITKTAECNGATSCTMAISCLNCPPFLWSGDNCETQGRPPEVIFIPELTSYIPHSEKCPGSKSDCGDTVPTPAPPPAFQ
jgi:hypothetical protein